MATRVIRLYVISVEGRCPRCLRRIRPPASEPGAEQPDRIVCPHCEALLDVCDVSVTDADDDEEGGK